MTIRDISLPRLGETMESARLVRWLKGPGDAVQRGEPMLELETDKTIVELPSLFTGELIEQIVAEGAEVAVDALIARIRVQTQAHGAQTGSSTVKPLTGTTASNVLPMSSAAVDRPHKGVYNENIDPSNPRATPAARALARSLGVDLSTVTGSGRRSRIESHDITDVPGKPIPETQEQLQFLTTPNGNWTFFDSQDRTESANKARVPTALLIHGFAADHSVWSALASGLTRSGLRVLAPDLPSHGKTTLESTNLEEMGKALISWVTSLNLPADTALHVIGHSLGAVLASTLAEHLGLRLASLTLIAPIGIGSEIASEFIHGMAAADTAGGVSHLLRYLGPRASSLSDAMLRAMALELARARLSEIARDVVAKGGLQKVDILRKLGALAATIPVRVIVGLRDQVTPPEHARHLPYRVATHYFCDSGHVPMWDQPRELLDLIVHSLNA